MSGQPPTFAELVKRCRDDLGLSQAEFAEQLGVVNQSAIAKWELGRLQGTPRADRIRRLSEVCNVPTGVLLEATGFAGTSQHARAAIERAEDPDRAELHDFVDRLSARQVRALLAVVRVMVRDE